MQKRLLSTLFGLVLLSASLSASAVLDSLLNVYDDELSRDELYITRHQALIDSLRRLPQTPELQLQIAREYQSLQSDSSCVWYVRLQTADEPVRRQAFFGMFKLLASSGHFAEAISLLRSDGAPDMRSSDEFKMVWLFYSEAIDNACLPSFRHRLDSLAGHCYRSMLRALEDESASSPESALWLALYRASDRGDWAEAIRRSEQLLMTTRPDEHQYAILAYGHAMLYEKAGDRQKRDEWLVRSAITDVRCGVTDNGSSWLVAQDRYDAGDLERAYRYISYSLHNATYYNAPTRFIQIFTPGHIIASRYEEELHRSSVRLIVVLLLLAVTLLAVLLGVVYTRRQNRQLHRLNEQLYSLNQQLSDANHVKEQYICRYLEVYSDYIHRLTTMARKAGEKNATEFLNREMASFYRSFDDTFLSIYGDFVARFNALLKPEARLTPKPGERMTIEMRIFALILLGIDSSARIAQLLCYSPNTISNYRVKMKNNALGPRESFESRVCAIATEPRLQKSVQVMTR